jgi:hypothetical protein
LNLGDIGEPCNKKEKKRAEEAKITMIQQAAQQEKDKSTKNHMELIEKASESESSESEDLVVKDKLSRKNVRFWDDESKQKLKEGLRKYGKDWAKMHEFMPERTIYSLKS